MDEWLGVGRPFEDLVFERYGVVVVEGGVGCRDVGASKGKIPQLLFAAFGWEARKA